MNYKKECVERSTNKKIVCEEHKRKIVFINNNKRVVEKIQVDGCQITDGIRCDCLVNFGKIQNFIELKGKNIKHAIEQLKRSIKILGQKDNQIMCYIISSRSPVSSAEILNLKLSLKREFKADLKIKNDKIEVQIN